MRLFARIVRSFLVVALILGPLSGKFDLVCTASAETAAKPCDCEGCDDAHKANRSCSHTIKFTPSVLDATLDRIAPAAVFADFAELLAIPQARLPAAFDDPPEPPPPR